MAIPMFSSPIISLPIRAGMIFAIAVGIYSGLKISQIPVNPAEIIAGIISEFVLALIVFTTVRTFFLGPQLAGETAGFQIGFGLVALTRPLEEESGSVLGEFFFLTAVVIFFILDLHIGFLWGIKKSFELVPPFAMIRPHHAEEIIMTRMREAFSAAVQISLPLIIVLFILEIQIAIVSRTIPQFNIFVIGFPAKILVGILVLTFIFDRIAFLIGEFVKEFIDTFSDILKVVI